MEYIAVSSCLLGINTKYNGLNNLNPKIKELIKGKTVISICPEVFGGLEIPRVPSEIQDDNKIINKDGIDVTKEYINGAKATLDLLNKFNCKDIILKNGSPSCGNYTYDGTFSKTINIERMGITSKLLKDNGFNLIYID